MLAIYLTIEKDEREVAFASQPVSKGLSPKSPRQSGDEADQEEQSVSKCQEFPSEMAKNRNSEIAIGILFEYGRSENAK